MGRYRRFVAALLVIGLLGAVFPQTSALGAPPPKPPSGPTGCPSTAPTSGKTLIVFDSSGPYGHLGELFAIQAANLVGHFGEFEAKPTAQYVAGDIADNPLMIYIGGTWAEPIPPALFTDVATCKSQVLWMQFGIHDFAASVPNFAERYGWTPGYFVENGVAKVRYKGLDFTRRAQDLGALLQINVLDPLRAIPIASAVRPDGTTFPWAIRSDNLTYISEVPFTYATESDRNIIFSDLLFDLLAPSTPERHRALVRLEDVGPDADPAILRAIADYLYSRGVPFSVAVYPVYVDPKGTYNNGVAETFSLKDTPDVVAALQYMVSKGGTLIAHGVTHQYKDVANPYDGVSGNDFEFYRAHVDAEDYVRYDGPVFEDSTKWIADKFRQLGTHWKAARLPLPTIWEFPHYAASDIDYSAASRSFTARYERSLYFKGLLSGTKIDYKHGVGLSDYTQMNGQIFPYVVKDVYGGRIIPENLGNYEPVSYNHHPTRFPEELIESARLNLAVRDGFASFFYHPYLGLEGLEALKRTVEGIQGLGYTFVSPMSVL